MICGLDEAGRGAVLGPLVIVGAMFDEKEIEKLRQLGVKDSKQLSPVARDRLFEPIIKLTRAWERVLLSPEDIDKRSSRNKNLNQLELEACIRILSKLSPDVAYLDSFYKNPEMLKLELSKKIRARLIVEHKADERYLVVGAASVLAKVLRDREIQRIEAEVGERIGSGYPSDPLTVEFLKRHSNKGHPIIRKSWKAFTKLGGTQSRLTGFCL